MQDPHKLLVWKRAFNVAVTVKRASDRFPRNEYGSLRSQMVRAAESVVFNIAEGCGGTSQNEFARFLEISAKSTRELEAQLELAREYGVIETLRANTLISDVIMVRRMLYALRKKVKQSSLTT